MQTTSAPSATRSTSGWSKRYASATPRHRRNEIGPCAAPNVFQVKTEKLTYASHSSSRTEGQGCPPLSPGNAPGLRSGYAISSSAGGGLLERKDLGDTVEVGLVLRGVDADALTERVLQDVLEDA